jgi:hypothetical protein
MSEISRRSVVISATTAAAVFGLHKPISFMSNAFGMPGAGRMVKDGNGYTFVPVA